MTTANVSRPISNPLLVDLIANKLFDYLSLEDIVIQRGVCKLWQEIGLQRIKNGIDLIQISFDEDEYSEKSIEQFLEMAASFPLKFTNFSACYLKNNDAEPLTRLFDEYGNHMKIIELNLCGTTNSWTFLSDVLLNKAPNVERLHLESYPQNPLRTDQRLFSGKQKPALKLKHLTLFSQYELSGPTYSRILLSDLFESSPYLEELSIEIGNDNEVTNNHFEIVAVLQTLADKGTISNLKHLSLNVGNYNILEILATSFKSAPLERFLIHIYRMESTMLARIKTFLCDHKDTLRHLSLTFPCVDFLSKVTFPTMNNLKVLCIHEWCMYKTQVHEHRAPFGIFNFGKQFPNLLTLYICEAPISEGRRFFVLDKMFPESTPPVPTLKNLRLPPVFKAAMLSRIGRIFPNVLKLELVPQTPDVLKQLWTTWPEIKTLCITLVPYSYYRSKNLNFVFTGVDGSDGLRNFPSISNLRKLRHLRIDGDSYCAGSANAVDLKINNQTARFALAEMKDLVFFQISLDRHQISASCVQELCKEFDMLETEKEKIIGALHLVKYEWQKQSFLRQYE